MTSVLTVNNPRGYCFDMPILDGRQRLSASVMMHSREVAEQVREFFIIVQAHMTVGVLVECLLGVMLEPKLKVFKCAITGCVVRDRQIRYRSQFKTC